MPSIVNPARRVQLRVRGQPVLPGPYAGSVQMLYNKDMFDAAGIPAPRRTPMTPEQFIDYACQLTDEANGVWGAAASDPLAYIPWEVYFSDDGRTAEFNSPEAVQSFETLASGYDQGCLPTSNVLDPGAGPGLLREGPARHGDHGLPGPARGRGGDQLRVDLVAHADRVRALLLRVDGQRVADGGLGQPRRGVGLHRHLTTQGQQIRQETSGDIPLDLAVAEEVGWAEGIQGREDGLEVLSHARSVLRPEPMGRDRSVLRRLGPRPRGREDAQEALDDAQPASRRTSTRHGRSGRSKARSTIARRALPATRPQGWGALATEHGGRVARKGLIARKEQRAAYLFLSPWLFGLALADPDRRFAPAQHGRVGDHPRSALGGVGQLHRDVVRRPGVLGVDQGHAEIPGVVRAAVPRRRTGPFVAAEPQGPRINLFRTILFVPSVLSGVAVAVLWVALLNPDVGAVNEVLRAIGIDNRPGGSRARRGPCPPSSWSGCGGSAGGRSSTCPAAEHRAAPLRGCAPRRGRRMAAVPLRDAPMLTPTLLFVLLTGLIDAFQVFDIAYVLSQGGQGGWEIAQFYHQPLGYGVRPGPVRVRVRARLGHGPRRGRGHPRDLQDVRTMGVLRVRPGAGTVIR